MNMCPCGSGRDFDECCGPVIAGTSPAPTAEALMRARYSAHVVKNFDFIDNSMLPELRDDGDHEEMEKWSQAVRWDGLDILETTAGGQDDEKGDVIFVAKYTVEGIPQMLHERAHFKKVDGTWMYADGEDMSHETFHREAPKVGRNDPCPCGSGTKYKKCCGR